MAGENRGPEVLVVTAIMIALSTFFVFFRMLSRIGIVKHTTFDDYFILLAWVLAFGLSFAICYGTSLGLGKHEAEIPDGTRGALSRAEYAFTVLYNPALMATKTSICLFYLHLSRNHDIFKWSTLGTLAVVNVGGLALTFLNVVQCRPMSALFDDPKPAAASCTDIVTLYLSSAPVNIITDLSLLLLPMPVLNKMHLPRKQKIILYVTFGFGTFVTAVDVVRISYLQQAAVTRLQEATGTAGTGHSGANKGEFDFSWYASLSFMWSAIEVNVGIMCACVPGLKPLVSRFLPSLLRSVGDSETRTRLGSRRSKMMSVNSGLAPSPTLPEDSYAGGDKEEEEEGEMGALDFLRMPDTTEFPESLSRRQTTNSSEQPHKSMHFDFVKVRNNKPITEMTNRESVLPVAQVTILFFLWGFAYGLLNTLNSQFQVIAHLTTGQTQGIHAAYYVGYLIAPLTFGRIVLKRWGFKACYMVGLIIYGTGTLVFWPAAVLTSFAAFLVSNFIVGLGLSTLEIAANPFIALCGPPAYSEIRLNLSQAVQACGTVVSPLLAKKALFNNVLDAPSLIDVQWTYLAITLFTYLLAFVYYIIKLPEASDGDFEASAVRTYPPAVLSRLRSSKTIIITLALAVFSQFCYVGGQETISTDLSPYLTQVAPTWDYVNTEAIAHTMFAASRFLAPIAGILLLRFFNLRSQARYLLAFFYTGVIVFAALASSTSLTSAHPTRAAVFALMIYFFEGPLFSLIFALPLRALGRHTKTGSALLTAAISGGAVFLPGATAVGPVRGNVVLAATFGAGAVFAVWLNVMPNARVQVDGGRRDGAAQSGAGAGAGAAAGPAAAFDDAAGGEKGMGVQAVMAPALPTSPTSLGDLDFVTSAL